MGTRRKTKLYNNPLIFLFIALNAGAFCTEPRSKQETIPMPHVYNKPSGFSQTDAFVLLEQDESCAETLKISAPCIADSFREEADAIRGNIRWFFSLLEA